MSAAAEILLTERPEGVRAYELAKAPRWVPGSITSRGSARSLAHVHVADGDHGELGPTPRAARAPDLVQGAHHGPEVGRSRAGAANADRSRYAHRRSA